MIVFLPLNQIMDERNITKMPSSALSARTPAEACYSPSERLPFDRCRGRIAAEAVMCYPPGIPILAPGECVTAEALEYIDYAREKGSKMTGTEDPAVEYLQVVIE